MSILKLVSTAISKPGIVFARSRYLFILSHMRSRSSLLSHILGSNDCICGYSELQLSYTRYRDIIAMKIKLYEDLKCGLNGKYLLDKLLHNGQQISKGLLEAIKPKFIFLVRSPENTIKSTINMGRTTGAAMYQDPEKVSGYYCSRLSCLQELAENSTGDCFFLESDDLVNNTECVLEQLTGWLGLAAPLHKNYSIFAHTGKPGYGDPLNTIRAGEIMQTKGYPDIEIPREVLQPAEEAYEKWKTFLINQAV